MRSVNNAKRNEFAITRREFVKSSACFSAAWLLADAATEIAVGKTHLAADSRKPVALNYRPQTLNLTPAEWLWYPSKRTLPNTFVLFRRQLMLASKPKRAIGWVIAESRYCLYVNGLRIQWGPAPCDPRWTEADPVDLTDMLKVGTNVIGAQVLFYGYGDGTWPVGKPGFIFRLEIEYENGTKETVISDDSWLAHLARAWRPGQYKRWYLRALQEEFDARLFPYGWSTTEFAPDLNWLPAMVLNCPPDKPAVCSDYPDYMFDISAEPQNCRIFARTIPMLREYVVTAAGLAESMWINWNRPVEEYFEFVPDNAFTVERTPSAKQIADAAWQVVFDKSKPNRGATLAFELPEQMVGWPQFTIDAPAGTIVELMVQEGHQVGGPALLNTHFNSWSRFVCREGTNLFEPFDFESCRWIQLHIHNCTGTAKISGIGIRRRIFPWPNEPKVVLGEPKLQRLMDACVNTLNNSAQETCVDGMGRERQQYSGDGGHQLHAVRLAFGEYGLGARFVRTFSQGMTKDGYFLDCWPAYDRLNRIPSRQLDFTPWGPLLDHGVSFNFDCYHHFLYTGDLSALEEVYPRLVRFAHYLKSIQGKDGLLPVENIGVPWVWMDNESFLKQRHKQCAFNLFASAMFKDAFAKVCEQFGDAKNKRFADDFSKELRSAAVRHFWSKEHGLFVDNLPWLKEEKSIRLHDRTLSMAILFDQCPQAGVEAAIKTIVDCPGHMGFSYPGNAGWRLWALARAGRADVILKDLRERWANLPSVILNNTLQEHWEVKPDSGSQWSHCPVVPLYVLYMSIAGIRPLEPGFGRCEIRPQLGDLEKLDLMARTVRGPICFSSAGKLGSRSITVKLPTDCEGELVINAQEKLNLSKLECYAPAGHSRYLLPKGMQTTISLSYS